MTFILHFFFLLLLIYPGCSIKILHQKGTMSSDQFPMVGRRVSKVQARITGYPRNMGALSHRTAYLAIENLQLGTNTSNLPQMPRFVVEGLLNDSARPHTAHQTIETINTMTLSYRNTLPTAQT